MATISFTTTFDLSVATPVFLFEDTADYVGQGIALADVNGVFNITSPSGTVIYNNTDYSNGACDIRNSVSRDSQQTIALPLGSDGFPEAGIYTIVYSVYDTNLLVYSTITNTYDYAYVRPEVEITQTTDCVSPLFTSTDSTTYTVDSIVPSIVRSHTITFPVGSGLSPVVGVAATISVGYEAFANGTQSTTIVSDLTYVFDDRLIVIDAITGYQSVTVDCTDTCAIYCCLRSVEQQMSTYKTTNTALYLTTRGLFTEAMGIVGMVTLARTCNKSADISGYLTEIKSLLNCTDDCSCSGDAPALVTGLGGLVNNVVVNSSGSPITVTPVVVGTTTTYTITFNAALLTTINSLYNTIVAAGTNVTVTDSGIVGLTRTFTVNGASNIPVMLSNNTTPASTSAGVMTSLMSYTIPADQLSTNDDTVEVVCALDTSGVSQIKEIELRLAGVACHTKVPAFVFSKGAKYMSLIATISRQSNTTVFIKFDVAVDTSRYGLATGYNFFETAVAVNALSTLTNDVAVFGRNIDAAPTETVSANQLLVKYYNK